MSRYLKEYKHRASPICAEIMQKRAVDNQTFYQVKLVFPRGDAARRHGSRTPQALAVVGFDGIPATKFIASQLTTVYQPMAENA
jgi:hypothetical protein